VAAGVRGVVTPEAVVLEFETAGVASRSLAQAVDLGVRLGLVYVLAFLASALGAAFGTTPAIVIAVVGVFFIIFGYPALLEVRWSGQTVGKRMLGLRVLTVEGAPVRFRHAAVRSLLQIVDFIVPPVGVTATCVALLNKRNQRLGDIFAGTVVPSGWLGRLHQRRMLPGKSSR